MPEIQTNTPARHYETIYVLRPDAGRETSESISTKIQDVFSTQGGALTRVENWGYRKLAYTVRKQTRGVYVYLQYVGDGQLVSELERNLRLQDAVLKYQTVKLGDTSAAEGSEAAAVEFEHLDVPEEEEPEESFAKSLGLEDDPRGERDNDSGQSDDDVVEDDGDDESSDSSDDDDTDKEDA